MSNTTFVDLGTIKSFMGAVSVNFVPERKEVALFTHDPKDLRKAGVVVTLGAHDLSEFMGLLKKAQDMLQAEVAASASAKVRR